MQLVKISMLLAALAMSFGASMTLEAADTKADAKADTKTEAKADAKTKQKNVAIVNGAPISQARLDFVAKSQIQQAQGQQEDTPEFRNNIREILITRELLYQEALKRKLDKKEAYHTQLDLAKQQIILALLFEDLAKTLQPTDADARKEYEKVKAERGGEAGKQYKCRHILVKDEDTAKEIIAQLKAGGEFDAIAKEKSEDPGSKENGGQLDWSEAEGYVQPFGMALKALKKGELTQEPVKTEYGYHIIELQDVRSAPFPEFDQVKGQVQQQLATKMRDDYIAGLRNKAKIEKIDPK
jgi:peptidyl-prolyl cis-trans isomerase C